MSEQRCSLERHLHIYSYRDWNSNPDLQLPEQWGLVWYNLHLHNHV